MRRNSDRQNLARITQEKRALEHEISSIDLAQGKVAGAEERRTKAEEAHQIGGE